jgi:hypothetical protein
LGISSFRLISEIFQPRLEELSISRIKKARSTDPARAFAEVTIFNLLKFFAFAVPLQAAGDVAPLF